MVPSKPSSHVEVQDALHQLTQQRVRIQGMTPAAPSRSTSLLPGRVSNHMRREMKTQMRCNGGLSRALSALAFA
jgi:hypothetical protein